MSLYSRESSARRWHGDLSCSGRSLICARNRRGSSTVPLGTPDVTGADLDEAPSSYTCWLQWLRKLFIHCRVLFRMPYCWSFRRRRWWGTLLNAFEKSRRIASICWDLSRPVTRSWTVVISWDSMWIYECMEIFLWKIKLKI